MFWARPYTHPAEDGVAAWYHGDLPNTLTLLGGLPTDGDVHHSIDNTYLALVMNKGLLGAVVVGAVITFLAWRLVRHGHVGESLCLAAMLLYFLMENKPFLLSANPLVLLLPCAADAARLTCRYCARGRRRWAGKKKSKNSRLFILDLLVSYKDGRPAIPQGVRLAFCLQIYRLEYP